MCFDEVWSFLDVLVVLKDINWKLFKGVKDVDRVKKVLMDFYCVFIEFIFDLFYGMDVEDKLVFVDEVLENFYYIWIYVIYSLVVLNFGYF